MARGPAREAVSVKTAAGLAGLAFLYACGAWLATALTASAGLQAIARLATHWPATMHFQPLLMALFGTLVLAIVAILTVAVLARLVARHRLLWAAAIALPAALPWLWNAGLLQAAGLQFASGALLMLAFETAKTLLLPVLLVPFVPRFLPGPPPP
ncbi:MAG: hypothetical protein EPN72_02160 [Nevskiaceae bacterium]|nr:MAG: hypothetical protein EPN63_12910 [Nevskiaceae bacterium]TBR74832.1 MAG: hypothetical protein EPN72_02160 [Nevskiaceae bacterium]